MFTTQIKAGSGFMAIIPRCFSHRSASRMPLDRTTFAVGSRASPTRINGRTAWDEPQKEFGRELPPVGVEPTAAISARVVLIHSASGANRVSSDSDARPVREHQSLAGHFMRLRPSRPPPSWSARRNRSARSDIRSNRLSRSTSRIARHRLFRNSEGRGSTSCSMVIPSFMGAPSTLRARV